ncbi:phosphotransferase, partial [Streptomyces sp. SID5998]|nr:phosphotransferase [Streptomyces sp. SID5998]
GRTVAVVGGHAYALHPWIDGRHRHGGQLTAGQCTRLGALLGAVHACLERVMPPKRHTRPATGPHPVESADPADTLTLIDDLLGHVRRHRPPDAFDELARHRLLERRALLEQHADRRPPRGGPTGWVHGDFHPFNLLYKGDAPAAIVDWDRLGVQPRAEEAVRAAAIFFVRPAGTLDLPKIRAYARAYRRSAGATAEELAAAVHRVWWERLNDFWMLRWHYERGDTRADPQFPAASALVVWWTREYDAVCGAFAE